jgi:hypothetical protein
MSGYTNAATLIANAMHQAYQEGTNLDEMFGVLSVQKEVTAVHLAQAALHQQAQLAKQASVMDSNEAENIRAQSIADANAEAEVEEIKNAN